MPGWSRLGDRSQDRTGGASARYGRDVGGAPTHRVPRAPGRPRTGRPLTGTTGGATDPRSCRNVASVTSFSERGDTELRDLVRRAKAGEGDALAALYDRYAERLYRYGLGRLGSPDAAEDLLQEVFVKVIEALPRYEERGAPFGAWLFRIARNGLVDRARAAVPSASLDAALDVRDLAPGPDVLAERGADVAALHDALGTLTAEQREVVLLRFYGGLSGAEIAGLMGKREGTIRALQFRAIASLRRQLEDGRTGTTGDARPAGEPSLGALLDELPGEAAP